MTADGEFNKTRSELQKLQLEVLSALSIKDEALPDMRPGLNTVV